MLVSFFQAPLPLGFLPLYLILFIWRATRTTTIGFSGSVVAVAVAFHPSPEEGLNVSGGRPGGRRAWQVAKFGPRFAPSSCPLIGSERTESDGIRARTQAHGGSVSASYQCQWVPFSVVVRYGISPTHSTEENPLRSD